MQISKLKAHSQQLQEAFLLLKNNEEVFNFIRDLMTEAEILEFCQRLEIANRLRNKESYKKIEKDLKVSSTTIARVTKYLK